MEYECGEVSREKWLATAKACPHATYFHTPYWYESIAPGCRHFALGITFDDGAFALVPVAEVRRFCGLLTDNFSSPAGTYGGWISADTMGDEHILILMDILLSIKNLTLRMSPLAHSSTSWLAMDGFANDFTHTLDLTKGVEALSRGLSKGHKSAIRSAAREGVTVKAAETAEEWDKYYGLYIESVERWRAGGPERKPRTVYPRSLFSRICKNSAGNEILWLAMKGGEPIAGALFFYWNRHAVSWHGSASSRHFNLRPNNLLYWEIIRDAAGRGYEIFDFNPSGGYAGVEAFKEHFGAVRTPSPTLFTRSPLRAAAARLLRRP